MFRPLTRGVSTAAARGGAAARSGGARAVRGTTSGAARASVGVAKSVSRVGGGVRQMSGTVAPAAKRGIVGTYVHWLERYPLVTKSVTSMVIGAAGDALCQAVTGQFDLRRNANMAVIGLLLVGPALHLWYGWLWRSIPGTSVAAIAKRLALDQLLFAPSFIVLFFAAMATAQGRAGETMARLETSYKDTLITNYKLWPAAQIVNFKFVPLQYQVLFANFVSVFWNAYLSWATNTPTEAPAAAPTA